MPMSDHRATRRPGADGAAPHAPAGGRGVEFAAMNDSTITSRRRFVLASLAATAGLSLPARGGPRSPVATETAATAATPAHGLAMHGRPALPPDFTHFPYVNPRAPKGGTLRLAVTGSFDSLNPYIIKGRRVWQVGLYVFEPLMARARSEPFSLYALIARAVEMPAARTSVTFHLDPRARFADGRPVTARDVLFSWRTLRDHGRLNHRTYYARVKAAEAPDAHTVHFRLDGEDRELPLILGLMPVLPAHHFASRPFDRTTLEPLPGSGPYRIAEVRPGQRVVFARRPDWWAHDLPSRRGHFNHERIVIDYFRDTQTAFEALKKGLVDLRFESDATRWATGYDFPAVREGQFVKEVVPTGLPRPLSAFVFNTRRTLFADRRVREALLFTFDFEWANTNLFYGLYERTHGYFDGSELSSIGRRADETERAILARAGARLEARFLDGVWRAPKSDGSGRDRRNLRRALTLLRAAGWRLSGSRLVDGDGRSFAFEMLVATREQERLALDWQRTLRLIGVAMSIRLVDSAQFTRRLLDYDYDMVPYTWYNSLSPGNEQRFYWGSAGRRRPGTRNYMGVADAAVDRVIDAIVAARERRPFVAAVRALDRLLVSGFYVIPLYHAPGQWVGRWRHVHRPRRLSLYGFLTETTWHEAAAEGERE